MKQAGPGKMLVVLDTVAGDGDPCEFVLAAMPEGDPVDTSAGEELLRELIGRPFLLASDDEVVIRAALVVMFGRDWATGPRFRMIEVDLDPEVDVSLLRRVIEAFGSMQRAREKKEKSSAP